MKKKRASQEEILKMMGRYQKTQAAEQTLPPLQELLEVGETTERLLRALEKLRVALMPEVFIANETVANAIKNEFGNRKDIKVIVVKEVPENTVYHITDPGIKRMLLGGNEQ